MAYNFLGLTNTINQRMNEVPLTSANFANATGVHSDIKNSVNRSINMINQKSWSWPFNHVTKELTLTVNQTRYPYEPGTKTLAQNTFRIIRDGTYSQYNQPLFEIDYEEYIEKYSDMEDNPTDHAGIPNQVFKSPDLQFGMVPAPDQPYVLKYEYYEVPTELSEWDDVPSIPEFCRNIIEDGAMYYAFSFKGDTDGAATTSKLFEDGIRNMKNIYISDYGYMRSTQRIR